MNNEKRITKNGGSTNYYGLHGGMIMKKKIIAFLMVLIMSACFLPALTMVATEAKVKAAVSYDREKALNYAASHWNDGKGLCAEFVSNAINAGGISKSAAWSKGCTTLRGKLVNSGLGTEYEISLKSDMSIKASDYEGKLSPGDIIFYYCPGCLNIDKCPYIHAVLYAGMDSSGYAKCYSHNNANNASKRYYYSKKCYSCGTAIKKAYVFHFNTDQPDKPQRPNKRTIEDGWYWIETACDASGNCVLNICGDSKENGGNLIIYQFERTGNELFYVHYEGNGTYSLMSYSSGKYLHIQDNSDVIENVHQWEGNTHNNSRWYIIDAGNGYYFLENMNNGGFLDLSYADTTSTNNIWTYSFNGNDSERWRLVPYGEKGQETTKNSRQPIKDGWYWIATACDASGNSVLNICGDSKENGGNLIIYPYERTGNELFYVHYEGDGTYSIMSYSSGKYLHIQDNSYAIENVHQWDGNTHNNSRWYIIDAGNGYCYLENKNNSGYLDLTNADITPTTNIGTYNKNYTNAQRWKFIPYS